MCLHDKHIVALVPYSLLYARKSGCTGEDNHDPWTLDQQVHHTTYRNTWIVSLLAF